MLRRSNTGVEPDRLEAERVDFFERARDEYLRRASEPRFLVVDAAAAIDEIHQKVLERVKLLEQ